MEQQRAANANTAWPRGCVQVYTGNGKGKTTAALGLALRAAGAGLHVFVAQFIKGRPCSEHKALQRFADLITVEQFGRGCFVHGPPSAEDMAAAARGLAMARREMESGKWALVILDEANTAVDCGLFAVNDLLDCIQARPAGVELIITGRNAADQVIAQADLVTEMCEVKHYCSQGIPARRGIEL